MGVDDSGGFEEFARAQIAPLSRFAGVLTGDRQLAHDVLADALIATRVRWQQIGAMEYPTAYVRRIVVTTFLAGRRRDGRRRTDVTDDERTLDRVEPDGAGAVDDRIDLAAMIQRLPSRQRTHW
ncbi:MAG: hypothetical protein ACR2P2_05510 [Nakamurella sp.]